MPSTSKWTSSPATWHDCLSTDLTAGAGEDHGEFGEAERVGDPGIGRLGPGPERVGEERAHGGDVAMIGRALDLAFGRFRAQELDEEREESSAGF